MLIIFQYKPGQIRSKADDLTLDYETVTFKGINFSVDLQYDSPGCAPVPRRREHTQAQSDDKVIVIRLCPRIEAVYASRGCRHPIGPQYPHQLVKPRKIAGNPISPFCRTTFNFEATIDFGNEMVLLLVSDQLAPAVRLTFHGLSP